MDHTGRARRIISWMDEVFYAGFTRNWDDDRFRRAVLRKASPHHLLLDLGAGAGVVEQMDFRDIVARTVGLDLERRVLDNPRLGAAEVGDVAAIPHPSDTFDLVIANNLLEHLEHPAQVFEEVARVLRPGGWFLAKTSNACHYVAMIARCTPYSLHKRFNAWRGRNPADTYPTYYRANTARRIRRLASDAELTVASIEYIEGRPEYLRFNPLAYAMGTAYERVVSNTEILRHLRVALIIALQRAR